jgi:hypothetical protein
MYSPSDKKGKMTRYLFKEPTLYDYWKITSQEISLAHDNKNKTQAFRSGVNLIRGFNDDTFRYMGEKGYFTGLALQDYKAGKTGKEVMDERNGFKTDFYDELLKKIKKAEFKGTLPILCLSFWSSAFPWNKISLHYPL